MTPTQVIRKADALRQELVRLASDQRLNSAARLEIATAFYQLGHIAGTMLGVQRNGLLKGGRRG